MPSVKFNHHTSLVRLPYILKPGAYLTLSKQDRVIKKKESWLLSLQSRPQQTHTGLCGCSGEAVCPVPCHLAPCQATGQMICLAILEEMCQQARVVMSVLISNTVQYNDNQHAVNTGNVPSVMHTPTLSGKKTNEEKGGKKKKRKASPQTK